MKYSEFIFLEARHKALEEFFLIDLRERVKYENAEDYVDARVSSLVMAHMDFLHQQVKDARTD